MRAPAHPTSRTIALTLLLVLLVCAPVLAEPVTGVFASVDKSVVELGQLVVVRIEEHPTRLLAITITDGNNTFRYNGPGSTIGFSPQQPGEHRLLVRDRTNGETLETLHFLVGALPSATIVPLENATTGATNATDGAQTAPAETAQETVLPTRTRIIETDKQRYATGETVRISLLADDVSSLRLHIEFEDQIFRFLGEMRPEMRFEPDKPGAYRVVAAGPDGAVIDSFIFTVDAPELTTGAATAPVDAQSADDLTLRFAQTPQRYKVRDAHGRVRDGTLRIIAGGADSGALGMLEAQDRQAMLGADIEFTPAGESSIKRIRVRNLMAGTLDLGVDEFIQTPTALPAGLTRGQHAWTNQYAIDPTRTNASDLTVTVTATGDALYVCKDWDFTNRQCLGAWVKSRDLTPGETYTVTLDPTDPGFGETISIPSNGYTQTQAGNTITVRLCGDAACTNTTTVYRRGDTVFVTVNVTPAYIRTTAKNQFDVLFGADTGAILSQNYTTCIGTAPDGPYSSCQGNFTIDQTWADGWYYIDSEQTRTQAGGVYTTWRQAFIVGDEPAEGDSLKFFADSAYTMATEKFGAGQQVYVEWDFSAGQSASATTTIPVIRNFKQLAQAGTTVTESFSNTTGPYRFNFSMPNLGSVGWYTFSPNLTNTSGGQLPDGIPKHGRLILFMNNTAPSISAASTNTPPSAPRSVGQTIWWNVSINDTDETDTWVMYVCSNSSFNAATRTCGGATTCANTTFSRLTQRSCQVTANSTMNVTNTGYAFVCDTRNCSTGRAINWSIVNDTTAPTVDLITPIDDPAGGFPKTNFTVTFNFVAADNYGLANCSLYTNRTGSWALTATNATITNGTNNYITHQFGADGSYKWNVQCSDYAGNRQFDAANRTLHIAGPPIVSLISPQNATYRTNRTVPFSFNATYGSTIENCSLHLNGTLNQTITNITQGANLTINATFAADGPVEWNVQCTGADGVSSFGDGVAGAGIGRTVFLDTTPPEAWLVSPGDASVINISSVEFSYAANDSIGLANCSLYVDGVSVSTVSSPVNDQVQSTPFLVNNGDHSWYVSCADRAANQYTTPSRTVTVNSSAAGAATLYETDYAAGSWSPVANINLSPSIDATSEGILSSIPRQSMKIYSRASSTPFQGNGILIYGNSTVNFSGVFTTSATSSTYVTWKLYRSNSTADTLICQSGDDGTGGTALPSNGRQIGRNACTVPANGTRILGPEWLKMQVDIYNSNNRARGVTHHIDNLSSYVAFNFTRLGVLSTNLIVPAINLSVGVNETLTAVCTYNCSGGACLGVQVYLERNTTTGWQTIPASGGVLILNGTETDPHAAGTVAYPGGSTSFTIKANTTGASKLRCNATSTYSSALPSSTVIITVANQGAPTILLVSPQNNTYTNGLNTDFTYIPSSNKNLANCSLTINNVLNQTNTTPAKDATNSFRVLGLDEGIYNWSVSCTDTTGVTGNSSRYVLTVDRGPPGVWLNAPSDDTNWTVDTLVFNWTATDSVATAPRCNVTIDGAVRASNVNSPSGANTTSTISGLTIGMHYWNVTCADSAGNRNTSMTWRFNITNLPHNVTLLSPQNRTWTNAASVDLQYNITHPISSPPANCSLYINGTLNRTNTSAVLMNQTNTFSVNTFTDGAYTWYVRCVAPDGLQNTSQTRTLYVDRTPPSINLTYPGNDTVLAIFNVPFRINATDNLAPNLTCNLTLDGSVNVTNFTANNSRNTSVTVNGIADGTHAWNVTCVDLAGNANTSHTYQFSAIAPPVVTLINPPNNGFNNTPNLTLIYNVSENNAIASCALWFDGAYSTANQTPVTNNARNNFSINDTSEGVHTWTVNCTDAGGYTGTSQTWNVTVDYTLPTVNLTGPADGSLLRSPVVVVNWSAYDNIDASLVCNASRSGPDGTDNSKTNIASPNGSITSTTYSGLPDGLHRWNVTCVDEAKNVNRSLTWTFNISALPSVSLVYPPQNQVNNSADITFTYVPSQSSGLASCTLIIDGVENRTNYSITSGANNYFPVTAIDEGTHNWSVNCTDNTGGTQNSSTRSFTVDLSPPNIALFTPANASVQQNNSIRFNYSPSDTQSSSLRCNLTINDTVYSPNQAVTSGAYQTNTILLRGGNASYVWNVTCHDTGSNARTSETWAFSLIAPPVVTLISPANSTGVSPNTTFTYFASDPFGIKNCSLIVDDIIVNSTTSVTNATNNNLSASGLTPGEHNWTVLCHDNDDDAYAPTPFRLATDVTPPGIDLLAPANDSYHPVGNVTFSWNATDDLSPTITCSLYLDGTNRSTNASANNTAVSSRLTSVPDGSHLWNVTCRDQVSNVNTSETRSLLVNQTPTITVSRPADNNVTNNATVIVSFTPSDNEGFTNCSVLLGGATNTSNQTPVVNNAQNNITLTLPTGRYNWSVVCYDNGTYRLMNGTVNRSLTVNLVPPSVELNAPAPASFTNMSWIVFNWTANETFGGTSICNLTINGSTRAANVASPSGAGVATNVTWLNDSYHVWNVTCLDPAGNSNTSETRGFTVTAPPVVSLAAPPTGLRTNATLINFTFTPSDNSGLISSCALVIDGVENRTIPNPVNGSLANFTIPGFVNGSYAWYVNCTDAAGNSGNSTTRTLLIDRYPPRINLTSPPNGSSGGTNVTFNWTAYDAGTVVTCNLTLDGVINASNITGTSGNPMTRFVQDVPEGSHEWNVTCWDDLLQTNTSLTYNFTVNAPDLVLNETVRLLLNNTNPDENETILLSANVSNLGGVAVTNSIISFWDGTVNIGNASVNLTPNQTKIVSVVWNATPGLHQLTAHADYDDDVLEMDEGNNNVSRNFSILRAIITAPPNRSVTNSPNATINFTLQNFTGGTLSYRLFVDGTANWQNGTAADNESTQLNLTLTEGVHRIIVQANDSVRLKNSTPLTIIVDLTPPNATILTPNGTFFPSTTPNITVRITDVLDASINYTMFVNGARNATGSVANATAANVTLSDLTNGTYELILQGTDDAGNAGNSTPIIIYIDSVAPSPQPLSPPEGTNFSVRTVTLNFSVTDNLDPMLQCNVTLDGSMLATFVNITNGSSSALNATNLAEGTHRWNVTCWDGNNAANQVNNANTSPTYSFNVYIPPVITLLSPANNTMTNNDTVVFTFNASDETGLASCSLLLNGTVNQTKTTAQLTLNGTNSFTVAGLNDTILWSVTCTDNSTGLASATTNNHTLIVDTVKPLIDLLTQNRTWFNQSGPGIRVNATDNYATNITITLFVDGAANTASSALNGTATTISLSGLADGAHTVIAQATDRANNSQNTTPITIYVDTVAPVVTLLYPPNGTNLTSTDTWLNFTASDNLAIATACTLTLDGTVVQYNLTNSTNGTYYASGLASGWHYWNATCIDNASNVGRSPTWQFFVQLPDFSISASDIALSNTTPVENQTIQVNATVFNLGQLNYTGNVTVQFWLGDPDAGGVQIGQNITVQGLDIGENKTVNATANTIIGLNQLYIVIDPPYLSNGSVRESNETNNKAHQDVWVGLFEVFAGGQSSTLHIADASIIAAFTWNQSNVTGGNVLITDSESTVSFTSLQAIGRNTTNGTYTGTDDFEEIDTRLNTTALNDSVNKTFTRASAPLAVRDITAFKRPIRNVPVINSTNTSSFMTGILWDTADGGAYYNRSQDIVFITVMNQSQAGRFGVYDYEVAVPAKLRDYIPGGGTVTFYTELR